MVQHCTRSGKGLDIQGTIEKANTVGSKVSGKSQVVWVERDQVKLLLLGCDDGTIEIYKVPSLSLVATIKSQSKLIQSHIPSSSSHGGWRTTQLGFSFQ